MGNQSPTTTDDEPLVTWQEPARLVGKSQRAFWDLVHKHGLPVYMLNSRTARFKMSLVRQWLESRRVGSI